MTALGHAVECSSLNLDARHRTLAKGRNRAVRIAASNLRLYIIACRLQERIAKASRPPVTLVQQ